MNLKSQFSVYQKTWENHSKLIREGNLEPLREDFVWYGKDWRNQDNPPLLAAVIIVPSSLWEPIQHIQANLERIDPRQRYHHPSYFHITLEEFGWEDEVDLRKLMRLTKKIRLNLSQFEIELKGVNCFPRTIFIQVFDSSQTLLRIYKDIHEDFPNLKEEHPEYIPHVSIADVLTNEACKLVTAIESKYRKKRIGQIKVDSISIVASRPYLTVGRIEARRTIPLHDTR